MEKLSRRRFLLRSGGTLAAGAVCAAAPQVSASSARQTGSFPQKPICGIVELQEGVPYAFTYPDRDSPCALIKLGRSTAAGVGPERDLVAFSTLCPHMGCALGFDADRRRMECPCHFSIFDCEREGQQVCGQATQALARIALSYDPSAKTVHAVAIAGAIYGRLGNLSVRGEDL